MVRKDRDPQGKQALAAGSPQELRVAWKYRVLRYSPKDMVARRSAQERAWQRRNVLCLGRLPSSPRDRLSARTKRSSGHGPRPGALDGPEPEECLA